jgi:zinc transporter ZupT
MTVPAATPARDWKTWLLWAVLVGAAALIGGLALSLLRKH